MSTHLLAIDPGKDKCGVALVGVQNFDPDRVLEATIEHRIVPRESIIEDVRDTWQRFPYLQIVLGDATTSRQLRQELKSHFPQVMVHSVDETGSTLEARGLYWQKNPPRGWRRWLPLSSQVPPQPIDDFAAIVLAQRFLTLPVLTLSTRSERDVELG